MKIIGLAGVARSGKDTFCNYALRFLATRKIKCTRKSLADALKYDLKELCIQKIGVNVFTGDPTEKEILRPLLVTYGTDVMRTLNPRHWIERLERDLLLCRELGIAPIITDIRYQNEVEWLKEEMGGICVHISQNGLGPANKTEAKEDPFIKKEADYRIRWPHYGEDNIYKAEKRVNTLMNKIYKNYYIADTVTAHPTL